MSATTPYSYRKYQSAGGVQTFSVPFPYLAKSQVHVYCNGVELTVGVQYAWVSNTQIQTAASVVGTIIVRRITPLDAPFVDFADGSTLVASDLDLANIQHIYNTQELDDENKAAIAVDPATGNLTAGEQRISDVLDPVASQDIATKHYVDDRDAATLVAAGAATAASAASAATSATNAATSASASAASATNASTSAGAASTSATNASTSATNANTAKVAAEAAQAVASTSASNAASSASNAAISASNANTAKVAAQVAQVAAESARDQTLAAYDSFDDRYLGPKASDPTLDNDGNPLLAGALYFNTAPPGQMRLYTGTAWVAAYVSGVASSIGFNPFGGVAAANVQAAIEELDTEKAPLASPTFTGTPAGPTAAVDTNTTQLATTAFVLAQAYLKAAAAASTYAPLASPTFTGTVNLAALAYSGAVTTTSTGIFGLPSGSTAQRPGSPVIGLRYNNTLGQFEGWNGTAWGAVGAGAMGGNADRVFFENDQTVTTNYTITSGKNAITAGPVTIANGVVVTIPSGSVWSIV